MKVRRIHICGAYGSGKTTLAKELSKLLKIPYYSFDDIKYIVKYTKKRPLHERRDIVKKIASKPKFIIEGAWSNYGEEAFKNADLIILVNTKPWECVYQVVKRYVKKERNVKNDFKTALIILKKAFVYYYTKSPISFKAHMNLIKKYNKDHILLNNRDKTKLFNQLMKYDRKIK
jgi:adenylate kinase family enzyme